jgi:hypothetical protein
MLSDISFQGSLEISRGQTAAHKVSSFSASELKEMDEIFATLGLPSIDNHEELYN